MIEKILAGTLALSLGGCSMLGGFNALDPKNLIKTAATTGVTYVIAGPIPAAVNAATSVAVDSVLPDDKPAISDIEAGNEEHDAAGHGGLCGDQNAGGLAAASGVLPGKAETATAFLTDMINKCKNSH